MENFLFLTLKTQQTKFLTCLHLNLWKVKNNEN